MEQNVLHPNLVLHISVVTIVCTVFPSEFHMLDGLLCLNVLVHLCKELLFLFGIMGWTFLQIKFPCLFLTLTLLLLFYHIWKVTNTVYMFFFEVLPVMKILFVVILVCHYICTNMYLPVTLAPSASMSTSDFTPPIVNECFVGFTVFYFNTYNKKCNVMEFAV